MRFLLIKGRKRMCPPDEQPSKKVAESDVVTVVLQAISKISNVGRTAQLKRVVSGCSEF